MSSCESFLKWEIFNLRNNNIHVDANKYQLHSQQNIEVFQMKKNVLYVRN